MSSYLVKQRDKWAKELSKALAHITWCERCGTTNFYPVGKPDIAHSEKRRFIVTRELYFEAVKLCRACHEFIEYGTVEDPGTHERMKFMVLELIQQR